MTALRLVDIRNDAVNENGERVVTADPVNFTVAGGECIGVSGASGTGKTLLLRAIADLDPNSGEVYLDGTARSQISAPEWRARVAYVPAESAWWDERLSPHFHGRRVKHLQRLGFDSRILSAPISRLSTGERQRFAILRTLNATPAALLLDEPTASLDSTNRERVERLIKDYSKTHDAPVIWISHDTRQIRRVADRHLRFHKGRLREVLRRSRKTAKDVSA